jgi:hypothetical protein
MKKILLTLVGVVGAVSGSFAQTIPSTINLTGLGGFDREFSAPPPGSSGSFGETNFRVIDGSYGSDSTPDWAPYMGYTMYSFVAGPPNMVGQPQYTMMVLKSPTGQTFIRNISDSSAPWMSNAFMQLDESGNVVSASGYATGVDPSGHSVIYDGGGFGPAYLSSGGGGGDEGDGSVGALYIQAQELNIGLTFTDGQWTVKE